jgi:tetratricopeptide (TPR) repeat protein
MRLSSLTPVFLLAAMSAVACTNTNRRPTTPATHTTPVVRGDEFRVVAASSSRDGDAYDAALLFDRANAAVREQRCTDAIADYERLVREFPDNRRAWVSQYNRGLCLQRMSRLPEAADAMRAAARDPVDAELTRDASFRLAVLGEQAQEPRWVVEATDTLLARPRLEVTDRVEALARRAAALLAQGDRDGAQRVAEEAAQVAPTPEAVSALGDDTYAAQARVVLAEVTRLRAADVVYRVEESNAEESITRRVQLVTHAHVQFNEAIRVGNPHWAAAAGFRIGN